MRDILALTAVFVVLAFGMARAQPPANCAPHDVLLERLASTYGEQRQAVGLGANNVLVEVFASDDTGTWTITMTVPGGMTCLVASGEAYQSRARPPGTPA